MKKTFVLIPLLLLTVSLFAQKVDSIYFHLYTDSLKKGTHNYINADGKLHNGRWLPLTAKEITLTASYGEFEGNDLILPLLTTVEKITVKAVLITNPEIFKEVTIWIKKKPDDEILQSKDNMIIGGSPKKSKTNGHNKR